MTPAERQRKCRAIKRGEWHTIQGTPCDRPNALPAPPGRPVQSLPPPPPASAQKPRALPAPPVTALQKANPANVTGAALALPDVVTSGDALRLSLPAAVANRLRSLLDRQDAGKHLTAAERAEAQGLLDIAEYFVVQRLRQRFAA